jgi:26S proteasome regulatory subunit N7
MDIEKDSTEILKEFDQKIADAEENAGDIEVRDALIDKAEYLEKINQVDQAIEVYKKALEKAISIGKRMEILFFVMRIYFEKKDLEAVKTNLDKCKAYQEEGGDWERKNKLKASYLSIHREL